MDTSRIALDANLMLAVDARRFLCAMQEMTGGHIWATEQVWREVWGACVATCHRAARRSVQSGLRRGTLAEDVDARKMIVDMGVANVTAMRHWLEDERRRNDRAWEYVASPESSSVLQLELLDSGALTDNKNKHKDALVVAEAALAGAHIVSSDNLRTIRHGVLNAWLADRKAEGHPLVQSVQIPFVLDPDATAYAKCRYLGEEEHGRKLSGADESFGRRYLGWTLAACRPADAANMPLHRLEAIVRRFVTNVQRAGLVAVGGSIAETLDSMGPDEREFQLRHAGGRAERTRASEDRRLAAVHRELAAANIPPTEEAH